MLSTYFSWHTRLLFNYFLQEERFFFLLVIFSVDTNFGLQRRGSGTGLERARNSSWEWEFSRFACFHFEAHGKGNVISFAVGMSEGVSDHI